MERTFREWLNARVGAGKPVSQRELARRLAGLAPSDGDPENTRRTVGRIARGEVKASQPTRDAIQRALDDRTAPSVDDEDEAITREMVLVEVEEMIHARNDELRKLRRFQRVLTNGGIA